MKGRSAGEGLSFGVSLVRMMEFAWALIEPEKGRFDFRLFDRAIGILAERGIDVILGTPTATFPAWLLDEGEVLQVSRSGRPRDFGSRRMGCFNSPAYREASRRVALACARHFGGDERVVGWQVDNEIGTEGSDICVCDNCRAAWQAWLERRYGSVGAMNAEWGSLFWGASFSRWDQVPVPRDQVATGFNPGLLLDYARFSSDSAASFVEEQEYGREAPRALRRDGGNPRTPLRVAERGKGEDTDRPPPGQGPGLGRHNRARGREGRGMGVEVVERRTVDGGTVKVVLNHNARSVRALGRRIGPYGLAVIG